MWPLLARRGSAPGVLSTRFFTSRWAAESGEAWLLMGGFITEQVRVKPRLGTSDWIGAERLLKADVRAGRLINVSGNCPKPIRTACWAKCLNSAREAKRAFYQRR